MLFFVSLKIFCITKELGELCNDLNKVLDAQQI